MKLHKTITTQGPGLIALLIALLFGVLLSSCSEQKSQLDLIYERDEIRIATKNGPTTYYFDRDEATGLEYELATRFADYLGIPLNLIVANNNAEIIDLIKKGEADIAAAGFTNSQFFNQHVDFGPDYQWITYNVVYRLGTGQPKSFKDVNELHLPEGAIQADQQAFFRDQYPDVRLIEHTDSDSQELLELLQNGEISYTVASSTELAISKFYYPDIRAAFLVMDEPQPLAWAFNQDRELSLDKKVEAFFTQLDKSGTIASLINHFYGAATDFDYVDSRKFIDRFYNHLPQYMDYFKNAAANNDMDWRLLASLAYQESHWNEGAVSPTGVRGMMMLTQTTARSVGVKNRMDPIQSINGGTKYLKYLIENIPEQIQEPHKTWFALAAYNVGSGHVEDARIITEKQGGDPDNWEDVMVRLPLLSKKKWYKDTEYGYARGHEPVNFVEKIRRYYSALIHLTQPEHAAEPKLKLVDATD